MADIIRKNALETLAGMGEHPSAEVKKTLERHPEWSHRDGAFYAALVETAVMNLVTIDSVIAAYSSVRLKKLNTFVLASLRLALAQILFMDRVPDSAATNEAVNLLKAEGTGRFAGFANGILRHIIREKKELVALKKAKLKECKANKRYHKEEYRAYKKKIKADRKAIKEEYDQKIDELVLKTEEAIGEIKVKEKDLTPEEIALLRKSNRLPFYLRSEEIFNSVTHMVGGGIGVISLIVSILCCCFFKQGNVTALLSMIVFSLTMIALYTISAVYHGLYVNRGKRVLQVLDHCTIYLLIAGTYTPYVLLSLSSIAPYHYVFLGGIYLLSILGIVLNATMMRKMVVKVISMILYILIGWSVLPFYPLLVESLTLTGTWILIGGGISYTVGSILYGIGSKKKYFHSIFHLFVLLGSLLQYVSILIYGVIL